MAKMWIKPSYGGLGGCKSSKPSKAWVYVQSCSARSIQSFLGRQDPSHYLHGSPVTTAVQLPEPETISSNVDIPVSH